MDATKDYLAGLAAGVATVLIGHPFDTVKVKLQTQNTDAHSQKYRNAIQCTSHILKTEGPKGLYRGATSSFVGVSIESAVLFGAYSQIKANLQGDEVPNGKPPLHVVVPAAGLAGAGVGFILCPTELVKCRLQVQAKDITHAAEQTLYAGPLDCVRKILKNEGINGLFRGGTATIMRETCGNMLFFTTYETTRYHLFTYFGLDPNRAKASQTNEAVPTQSIVANTLLETGIGVVTGGLAGVAFWSGVLPFDVAKTRIQTARNLSTSRNPLYHLRLIHKQAGIRGLYAGIGPTLTRAFPANAAAIVAWELTARMLHMSH
ncbi:hypothetical protein M758_6G062100 [Ceratodon purpureus]|nr:hypothetical protein M758_6G062100 [Ceratodon purpureus]